MSKLAGTVCGIVCGKDLNANKVQLASLLNQWKELAEAHISRVAADGGVIPNQSALLSLNFQSVPEIKAFYDPDVMGYKVGTTAAEIGKLYSISADSDITFESGKQPLLLTYSDSDGKYLYLNETTGQQVISFDSALNRITGSIDIDFKIKMSNYGDIIGKATGTANYSWGIRFLTNSIQFMYSPDGTSTNWVLKSISVTGSNYLNVIKHLRITRNVPTGDVKFYEKSGETWNQIGTTQASTAGQGIFAGTSIVYLGNHVGDPFKGNIYEVNVYNGIRDSGGTIAVSFKASDVTAENNSYIKSSLTGEQWIIPAYFAGASNNLWPLVVERTCAVFNGTTHTGKKDFTIGTASLSANLKVLRYAANNVILDGYVAAESKLKETFGNGLKYNLNGGADIGSCFAMVGNTDVVSFVKNGANSKLKFDTFTEITGNAGSGDMTGISLGSDGTVFSNILLHSVLIRNSAVIKDSDILKIKQAGKNNYSKLAYILGDSISAGTGTAYPSLKWASLVCDHIGYKEYNLGVGGTTAQKRTPVDYVASPNFVDRAAGMPVNQYGSNAKIFVFYGINDISAGGTYVSEYNPTNFEADYRTAVASLLAKGYAATSIILIGIGYSTGENATTKDTYNAIIADIATDNGCVFVPIRQAMIDSGGGSLLSDAVHPNAAGHAVIAAQINAVV